MIKKLEPCPFCGSKDIFQHIDYSDITSVREGWTILTECECGAQILGRAKTEEQAYRESAKNWNTRYKRTCHVIKKRQEAGECSECGGFLFAANGCLPKQWTHCPNCGAEVADGD